MIMKNTFKKNPTRNKTGDVRYNSIQYIYPHRMLRRLLQKVNLMITIKYNNSKILYEGYNNVWNAWSIFSIT